MVGFFSAYRCIYPAVSISHHTQRIFSVDCFDTRSDIAPIPAARLVLLIVLLHQHPLVLHHQLQDLLLVLYQLPLYQNALYHVLGCHHAFMIGLLSDVKDPLWFVITILFFLFAFRQRVHLLFFQQTLLQTIENLVHHQSKQTEVLGLP